MNSTKADILLSQLQALHRQYYSDDQRNDLNKLALADVVKRYYALLQADKPTSAKPAAAQEAKTHAQSEIKRDIHSAPAKQNAADVVEVKAPEPAELTAKHVTTPKANAADEVVEPQEREAHKTTTNSETLPDSITRLFAIDQAQDISSRFANQPINSLQLAMSINERQLTIQELFAGDVNAFERTILTLDQASNFEEAKQFLLKDIISKYSWDSDILNKKASIFIKLVRRRYQQT